MILAKCLNSKCGYKWFGRRIGQQIFPDGRTKTEFIPPNNCPKCRKKEVEVEKYIFEDRENVLKNYFTARYYKVKDVDYEDGENYKVKEK